MFNNFRKLVEKARQNREDLKRVQSTSSSDLHPVYTYAPVTISSDTEAGVTQTVPFGLRVAAAWSWRMLLTVAAGVVGFYAISQITIIVIPVLVALLLCVLLEPVLRLFYCHLRLPRTLSAILSLLVGVGIVSALLWLATSQIISGMADVVERAQQGLQQGLVWLSDGPLGLDVETATKVWNQVRDKLQEFIQSHASYLASNALNTASSAATLFTGFLTALFCLFFFLKDGRRIWQWILRLFPVNTRNTLNEAVIRGWITLGAYARTQTLVAAIDAIGIGLGAYFIGVPLALPLGVLVFLASFVPILGAITTGFIAVLVALVDQGFAKALVMLLIILAVQQIESNLLQPALMSSAVNLHPIAVLASVAAGGYLMGITGAVFAVPLVAFLNTTILYMKGHDKFIYLNYWKDRPGGPPGSLHKEIAQSLEPDASVLREAEEMRKQAIAQGFLPADVETVVEILEQGKGQKASEMPLSEELEEAIEETTQPEEAEQETQTEPTETKQGDKTSALEK